MFDKIHKDIYGPCCATPENPPADHRNGPCFKGYDKRKCDNHDECREATKEIRPLETTARKIENTPEWLKKREPGMEARRDEVLEQIDSIIETQVAKNKEFRGEFYVPKNV